MGLFSKIKNAIAGKEDAKSAEADLEAIRREMRMPSRYAVSFHDNAFITVGQWRGTVLDISYGGVAVRFDDDAAMQKALALDTECTLDILGLKKTFQMKTVRMVGQGNSGVFAGFCFNHSDADTLLFLREIIEPIRQGLTIEQIASEILHDRYKGQDWQCFRGDGPVDIVFRKSGDTSIEALLTLRVGDSYFSIKIANNEIVTSQSKNAGQSSIGIGSEMAPTVKPDTAVLRRAFLVLSSAPVKAATAMQPLLQLLGSRVNGKKEAA